MANKDPEKERAYQREWYLKNREKIREKQRSEKARAWRREYYLANRSDLLEKMRSYNAAHRGERQEQQRQYRQRNAGKLREQKSRSYQENREQRLAQDRFVRHGLRLEDWAAMWAAQDGLCYLCGTSLADLAPRHVHVDHDHSCCGRNRSCRNCQRGLACHYCNVAIGHAGDDAARLRRMADALEAAQADVAQRKPRISEQLTLME